MYNLCGNTPHNTRRSLRHSTIDRGTVRCRPTPSSPHPVRSRRRSARDRLFPNGTVALTRPSVSGPSIAAAATSSLATPSLEPTVVPFARAEENTGRFVYAGPWSQVTSSSYSGGTARSVSTRGALVAVRFTGTAVRWIGPKGPTLGRAEVYVDGRRVATVDQSATRAQSKRVVWTSAALPAGAHRLEIHVLSTRGTYGTGSRVTVDAHRRAWIADYTWPAIGVPSDRRARFEGHAVRSVGGRGGRLGLGRRLAANEIQRRRIHDRLQGHCYLAQPAQSARLWGRATSIWTASTSAQPTRRQPVRGQQQLLWSAVGLANVNTPRRGSAAGRHRHDR